MPYSESHYKVTVYGDAYNGAEGWSFGWRMQGGTLTDAGAQVRASALAPVVTAFWSDATGYQFWNTHRLQGIKVAVIGLDGKYPADHVPGEVFFANVPGPKSVVGSDFSVPQLSLCVTLATAKPRGLASKGRFFLPPMDFVIGSDGLLSDTLRDNMVTRMKNFINAVNNAEVSEGDVAIFSRGRGVPDWDEVTHKVTYTYPNPGDMEPVTRVEVGRVLDTQRRRRRSLTELREGAALG